MIYFTTPNKQSRKATIILINNYTEKIPLRGLLYKRNISKLETILYY